MGCVHNEARWEPAACERQATAATFSESQREKPGRRGIVKLVDKLLLSEGFLAEYRVRDLHEPRAAGAEGYPAGGNGEVIQILPDGADAYRVFEKSEHRRVVG